MNKYFIHFIRFILTLFTLFILFVSFVYSDESGNLQFRALKKDFAQDALRGNGYISSRLYRVRPAEHLIFPLWGSSAGRSSAISPGIPGNPGPIVGN